MSSGGSINSQMWCSAPWLLCQVCWKNGFTNDHRLCDRFMKYHHRSSGIEQSRRDVMEILGYVWLYLLRENLPWMGLNARDQKQQYQRICDFKAQTSFESLCEGFPSEFVEYFFDVPSLWFEDEPNYIKLKIFFGICLSNLVMFLTER